MRKPLLALLLPGLAATVSLLAATVDLPRYQGVVELPPGPEREELVSASLTADIFEATLPNLADVRIADPQNQSVPYVITQRVVLTNELERQPVRLTRLSFNDQAEQNSIAVVFEREPDTPPPGRLTLHTPLRDFEKTVTVQGSSDRQAWTTLANASVIFDASRFMDVSCVEVTFPDTPFRYYQILIQDVTDSQASPVSELTRFLGGSETGQVQHTDRTSTILNRDFRIDRLVFSRTVIRGSVSKTRLIPVPVTNLVIRSDEKTRKTTIRFDARRTPATSLRLLTSSRNFSRRFTLFTLDPEAGLPTPPRREWMRGTLTCFSFRSLIQDSTEITFPENRGPVYELEIENGDNPALAITGVSLEGPDYHILYFSQPGTPCRLYFGDSGAKKPEFDISVIQTALDRGLLPVRLPELGASRPNPTRANTGTAWFHFNKKAALIGAMVVMVLVLGAALFKAARRMESGGGNDRST